MQRRVASIAVVTGGAIEAPRASVSVTRPPLTAGPAELTQARTLLAPTTAAVRVSAAYGANVTERRVKYPGLPSPARRETSVYCWLRWAGPRSTPKRRRPVASGA